MKASEILGRRVVDSEGNAVGVVHDLRAVLPDDDGSPDAPPVVPAGALEVVALVVGPDTWRCRLAHSWGFAQGHAQGPALLRALAGTGKGAWSLAPGRVASWDDDGRVRLRQDAR